jgi:hypothetical protein
MNMEQSIGNDKLGVATLAVVLAAPSMALAAMFPALANAVGTNLLSFAIQYCTRMHR